MADTIRLKVSDDGGGLVSVDDVNFGASAEMDCAYGETVTVFAKPDAGMKLKYWDENSSTVSTEEKYTFTVTGDRSLKAYFTAKKYEVIAYAEPEAWGTVKGGRNDYLYQETVILQGIPNEGYKVKCWIYKETGMVVSEDEIYRFEIGEDTPDVSKYICVFGEATGSTTKIILNANPYNAGEIGGHGTYDVGSIATLTAVANSGYKFRGWYDTTTGYTLLSNDTKYELTVPATASGEMTITAEFDAVSEYTVSTYVYGGGATIQPMNPSVEEGGSVTLTITQKPNYTIDKVDVDGEDMGYVTSVSFNDVDRSHTVSVHTSGTKEKYEASLIRKRALKAMEDAGAMCIEFYGKIESNAPLGEWRDYIISLERLARIMNGFMERLSITSNLK